MRSPFLKYLFLLLFFCSACDAVAQVRVGHMRTNTKKGKKKHQPDIPVEARTPENVITEIKAVTPREARKEMDALFYVPWNDKTGLDFEHFLCNKNLYNKFLPAKDTDLTKIIYPDYRIFYHKLNERNMAASGIDDAFLHDRIEHMLTERADSLDAGYISGTITDTNFIFTISIDSPAASAITINPVIYAVNESTYYYNISALFNKYESWMIVKSKDILEHEQIHFDIFELYARKMRKLLVESLKKNYMEGMTGDLTNEISPAFEQLYQELNDMQLQFDRETMALTSSNAPLFKTNTKWKKLLVSQIGLLNEYSIPEGTVLLK